MKKKLRWKRIKRNIQKAAGILAVFTMLAVILFWVFPKVKEVWTAGGADTETQSGGSQSAVSLGKEKQLKIELPEGTTKKDVSIGEDFLNQTIYVKFEKGVENYLENYHVQDDSGVAELHYYMNNGEGVLEICLDTIMEYTFSFAGSSLQITLINPREAYDTIVVLDAGHGGHDPGAVAGDVYEKTLNLDIVMRLKELFDEAEIEGLKVYYTRLDDTYPELEERVELANRLQADIFVSVHNNTSVSTKEHGTVVLYNVKDESEYSSRYLAELCLNQVTAATGSESRGLTDGDYVHIVRESEVPVALVEVGYMTNKEEFEKLQKSQYRQKVAQGIYTAILQAVREGF